MIMTWRTPRPVIVSSCHAHHAARSSTHETDVPGGARETAPISGRVFRGSKRGGASYEICPSCGFQFGVTDDDQGFSYEQWRKTWRAGGMQWSSKQPRPADWNPAAQKVQISRSKKKQVAAGVTTRRRD